jgi:demethylmenaquinone methyltransferase/2-methoxy-6-polyprenyl-1,4-benzoquinol methylase
MNKTDVSRLFDSISSRYDISNHIISLGLETIWRRRFLDKINSSDNRILDVCCGTGISTYQIGRKAENATVYGIDFSDGMIGIARNKYQNEENLVFKKSDITDIDLKDRSFDCVTLVFGIRNILDREKALIEFLRVTKYGGRIVILEFNYIDRGFFGHLFRFYLKRIMPLIGGIITGEKKAYEYLARTIKDFPDKNSFISLMEHAGWKSVRQYPITNSLCNIFIGYKE